MSPQSFVSSLKGQPIAIICARYCYRGILAGYDDTCLILTDPYAVEISGSSTNTSPEREDSIPSDILIKLDAIELIYQPAWVWHNYDHLKGKK